MSSESWKTASSGSWSTAADWTPTGVPNGSSAEATIAANGDYVVTIGTTQIYSADTLIIGAGIIGAGPTLDLLGTLGLTSLLGGGVVIGRDGRLEATGTIAAAVTNSGLIEAAKSTALTETPIGSGNLAIEAGATLELLAADSERVVFAGTDATLLIGAPAQFTGTISGFEQSDTIALAGIQASGVTVAGDMLDVLSGAAVVDTLALPADYGTASFSVVQSGNTALISETGITYSVEGPTWSGSTITWSFADTTYPDDASYGEGFTNYVSQSADQAIFEQAFAEWSAVTGLTFVEVADTTDESEAADIRVGWADFGAGGEIGEADYSYSSGSTGSAETFENDVLVRLEDPAADPIDTSSGTAIYSGTESSVMQVALHEIGHSIGLDHTPDPNAIMNPVASSANRQLDASDIAAGQALYAGDVACFAAGTRIRAARGEVAVEQLRPGDRVLSALSGAWVPVVWTGHRTIEIAGDLAPAPVQVRAHAFAPGVPVRDLLLSPDHAVCCGDALIPVRALIDGVSVRRLSLPRVAYWHVELPAHDVVLAEGLAAESYLDTGNRATFVEHDAVALHPAWSCSSRARTCLELHLSGSAVTRVRRRLAARARRLGWCEEGVVVRADGRHLLPARRRGQQTMFLVPAGVHTLTLEGLRPRSTLLNGLATGSTQWLLLGAPATLEVFEVRASAALREAARNGLGGVQGRSRSLSFTPAWR